MASFNRTAIFFTVFVIVFSVACQMAAAQEKTIYTPTEFFEGFPAIEWGMNAENVKKAIEKLGLRAIRPTAAETAWLTKFDGFEGRGAVRFAKSGGVDEVAVQIYYSEKGKEIYERWLGKLIAKQGEPREILNVEDLTSRVWKSKDGSEVLELRLLKGEDDATGEVVKNRYSVDIHWVKLSQPEARRKRRSRKNTSKH